MHNIIGFDMYVSNSIIIIEIDRDYKIFFSSISKFEYLLLEC